MRYDLNDKRMWLISETVTLKTCTKTYTRYLKVLPLPLCFGHIKYFIVPVHITHTTNTLIVTSSSSETKNQLHVYVMARGGSVVRELF